MAAWATARHWSSRPSGGGTCGVIAWMFENVTNAGELAVCTLMSPGRSAVATPRFVARRSIEIVSASTSLPEPSGVPNEMRMSAPSPVTLGDTCVE